MENGFLLNMSVWMKFQIDCSKHMAHLKCAVCSQFKNKLTSMRNYCSSFMKETANIRDSTFKDYSMTIMHMSNGTLLKAKYKPCY